MIEKIIGVVCMIGAGAMYTAERFMDRPGSNEYMVALTIFGVLNLLYAYGKGFLNWWNNWADFDNEPTES